MILLLHFDILSGEVGISAILPFSGFFVHHVAHDWSHELAKKLQPRNRSAS